MKSLSALHERALVSEPFLSVGNQLSSASWVHGLVGSVKSASSSAEDVGCALSCLGCLTARLEWLRAWDFCDVYSLLARLAEKGSQTKAAKDVLGRALIMNPVAGDTLVDLGAHVANAEFHLARNTSISQMLNEVSDVLVGSTLAEQLQFSLRIYSWMQMHSVSELEEEGATNLCVLLTSWVSQLCISLEVASDREKSSSYSVAVVRLAGVFEMICVAVFRSDSEALRKALTSCLSGRLNLEAISSAEDDAQGLVVVFDRLLSVRSYTDRGASVAVQIGFVNLFCTLVSASDEDYKIELYNSGLLRSCVRFIESAIDFVQPVNSAKILDHSANMDLLSCHAAALWRTLLSSNCKQALQTITESDTLSVIVKDWVLRSRGHTSKASKISFSSPSMTLSLRLLMELVSRKEEVPLLVIEMGNILRSHSILSAYLEKGHRESAKDALYMDFVNCLSLFESSSVDQSLLRELPLDFISVSRLPGLLFGCSQLSMHFARLLDGMSSTSEKPHYADASGVAQILPRQIEESVPEPRNARLKQMSLRGSAGQSPCSFVTRAHTLLLQGESRLENPRRCNRRCRLRLTQSRAGLRQVPCARLSSRGALSRAMSCLWLSTAWGCF